MSENNGFEKPAVLGLIESLAEQLPKKASAKCFLHDDFSVIYIAVDCEYEEEALEAERVASVFADRFRESTGKPAESFITDATCPVLSTNNCPFVVAVPSSPDGDEEPKKSHEVAYIVVDESR